METFLPYAMNRAIREADKSSCQTIGLFAYVLNKIIDNCQHKRIDHKEKDYFAYRGLKLKIEDI